MGRAKGLQERPEFNISPRGGRENGDQASERKIGSRGSRGGGGGGKGNFIKCLKRIWRRGEWEKTSGGREGLGKGESLSRPRHRDSHRADRGEEIFMVHLWTGKISGESREREEVTAPKTQRVEGGKIEEKGEDHSSEGRE